MFQSTHPRGVRRRRCTLSAMLVWFQSTHPRGVRPRRPAPEAPDALVSIHAPAWGATRAPGALRLPLCGFNPRTRVGCDRKRHSPKCPTGKFQSTHPRGVRPHGVLAKAVGPAVSIHAPAWGATVGPHDLAVRELGFNPRTRVGCDPVRMTTSSSREGFQSTHPRGVRPGAIADKGREHLFQSTHPRGVRPRRPWPGRRPRRFQSTHPRGVRLLSPRFLSF